MRRFVLHVCAVLASLSIAGSAYAYRCKLSESYSYISLSWAVREIPYGIRNGGTLLPDELVLQTVSDAFSVWTSPECTDVRFDYRGIFEEPAPGINQVVFVPVEWEHDRQAVALTRTTYGTEDGIIRAATIEVNERDFDFVDAATGCSIDPPLYDITAVLTHEVGHLLGLDHTEEAKVKHMPGDPTMAATVSPCEMDKRSLEDDDIQGLCKLYPAGEPPGACEPIPQQSDPYLANKPFGCSLSGASDDSSPWTLLFALAAMVVLRLSRRGERRSKSTCRGAGGPNPAP